MSNVTVGTNGIIEQPQSYGYTQGRGSYSKRSWKVTDSSTITTLLPWLASSGYSYEVTNGAFITVDARAEADPTGDNPNVPLQDFWERTSSVSEKDILSSNLAIVQGLTLGDKEKLKESASTGIAPIWASLSGDSAVKIGELIMLGVKSKMVFQPIVKHTYITANTYTVKWADTNVGNILTAGQLTSIDGCPSTVLFNLPTEASVWNSYAAGKPVFIAGFLKKPATIQQIAGGQWQLTQEYDFGLWSDQLYTAA